MPEFGPPYAGRDRDRKLTKEELVRAVLREIADEERVYAGEFLRLLKHLATDGEKFYAEGAEEVEELMEKLAASKKAIPQAPAGNVATAKANGCRSAGETMGGQGMEAARKTVSMDSYHRVLQTCQNIELSSAELYELFSQLYRDRSTLSRLWTKTALEEHNHAQQFELAWKMKYEPLASVQVDPWKAENALKIVQGILDNVRRTPPTPLDALRSAIKLEQKLAEFHLGYLATFTDEATASLFKAIMAADREHVAALEEAYQELVAEIRAAGGSV